MVPPPSRLPAARCAEAAARSASRLKLGGRNWPGTLSFDAAAVSADSRRGKRGWLGGRTRAAKTSDALSAPARGRRYGANDHSPDCTHAGAAAAAGARVKFVFTNKPAASCIVVIGCLAGDCLCNFLLYYPAAHEKTGGTTVCIFGARLVCRRNTRPPRQTFPRPDAASSAATYLLPRYHDCLPRP